MTVVWGWPDPCPSPGSDQRREAWRPVRLPPAPPCAGGAADGLAPRLSTPCPLPPNKASPWWWLWWLSVRVALLGVAGLGQQWLWVSQQRGPSSRTQGGDAGGTWCPTSWRERGPPISLPMPEMHWNPQLEQVGAFLGGCQGPTGKKAHPGAGQEAAGWAPQGCPQAGEHPRCARSTLYHGQPTQPHCHDTALPCACVPPKHRRVAARAPY